MLLNALAALGHRGIKTIRTFGRAGLMLFNALVGKPEFRKHSPLLIRQLYNVGVLSMLIIIVSGLFIGMVLGLQGYLVLTTYSAETSLGMLVALSLLRELGPVVAALLFAGRAGSALTAEIGLMRATDALRSWYRVISVEQRNPGHSHGEYRALNQAVHQVHAQIDGILHCRPEETGINPFPLHAN